MTWAIPLLSRLHINSTNCMRPSVLLFLLLLLLLLLLLCSWPFETLSASVPLIRKPFHKDVFYSNGGTASVSSTKTEAHGEKGGADKIKEAEAEGLVPLQPGDVLMHQRICAGDTVKAPTRRYLLYNLKPNTVYEARASTIGRVSSGVRLVLSSAPMLIEDDSDDFQISDAELRLCRRRHRHRRHLSSTGRILQDTDRRKFVIEPGALFSLAGIETVESESSPHQAGGPSLKSPSERESAAVTDSSSIFLTVKHHLHEINRNADDAVGDKIITEDEEDKDGLCHHVLVEVTSEWMSTPFSMTGCPSSVSCGPAKIGEDHARPSNTTCVFFTMQLERFYFGVLPQTALLVIAVIVASLFLMVWTAVPVMGAAMR